MLQPESKLYRDELRAQLRAKRVDRAIVAFMVASWVGLAFTLAFVSVTIFDRVVHGSSTALQSGKELERAALAKVAPATPAPSVFDSTSPWTLAPYPGGPTTIINETVPDTYTIFDDTHVHELVAVHPHADKAPHADQEDSLSEWISDHPTFCTECAIAQAGATGKKCNMVKIIDHENHVEVSLPCVNGKLGTWEVTKLP